MNLVQFVDRRWKRRVGIVAAGRIVPLKRVSRMTELAALAVRQGQSLSSTVRELSTASFEDYEVAQKERRLLPPLDHEDPAHCLITGTGLTHLGSASARDAMHAKLEGGAENLSDSLKMFRMGLDAGKPAKGKAGVQPEWFYKGDGSWLVAPAVTCRSQLSRLTVFLSQGIPLLVLCHLVLLNRPAMATPQTSGAAPPLEWYPIGRIIALATLMAGGLAFLSVLMLGTDLEQLKALMRELVEKVFLKQLPGFGGGKLGEPEINALAEVLLFALPAGSALLWLGGFMLNLWLGGKITFISSRLARPWPDVTRIRFPRGFGLGLAASLAALLLPGFGGLLASGFAGAFLFAYMLMGLAIIHSATRGLPARPFILWGLYLTLFVLNTWAGLVVAMIAVAEPLLPWRRPPDDGNSPPPPPST